MAKQIPNFMRASKELKDELKSMKRYEKESYEEVIRRLIGNRKRKKK